MARERRRPMKQICLVGFMGCGKTTVGKVLAERLKMKWVDLDAYIVAQIQMPISTFFEERGEKAFREIETKCLKEVCAQQDAYVISTGGGAVTTIDNQKLLQKAQTIYLAYPFDTLYERIKGDQSRPLVSTYEALHKRFKDREALYASQASVTIACQNKSIEDIVEEIIRRIDEMKSLNEKENGHE